ncbi:MAG: UDP-N-acetylmuramoyl-tripeptide--D-alanyl-D-alanine ligase [Bacteroidia bacterium]|nr:UDP-N-acetylmuramoyl-tripeptide--D-alanyl-D-alanine ligase [Bacteroidia bacterium]
MQLELFYNLFTECDYKFTTDSRSIPEGSIFFALKGDNFNGNLFAIEALKKGASYAVVDEKTENDNRLILVDDVLTFMNELAHFHRKCFDIIVIAIGGSNGKTTTKNLIVNVLKQKFRAHCTQGNFNNHIGVPITLLQIPIDCEVAIIELGTNNPGEIAALCKITAPTHGLITNIGKEHLEGFGTLEAVAKEESELYHYLLKNGGLAFVNQDDEWLTRMSRSIKNTQYYSKKDISIQSIIPSIEISIENEKIKSTLMGDYNLDNLLAAMAIGHHLGVSNQEIKIGIESYIPGNNRSQWIHNGSNQILLDAYNANPSSMQVAIENFSKMPNKKQILILGDMFEMGDQAKKEHLDLLIWAKQFKFESIYLLGEHFNQVSANCSIETYATMEALGENLKSKNHNDTAILIKGSRGMKMERVLDYL